MGMTALCYTVGNRGTAVYSEALQLRDELHLPIVRHYVPVPEQSALSEEDKRLRDLRVAKRMAERKTTN